MSTPLADRIKAKAKATAAAPLTPVGATGAMSKQAAVSATGKAAPVGGGAQSAIGETIAAEQGAVAQEAVAEGIETAGQQMAITEQAADVKQKGIESGMAMKKLAADNEFNNTLKQMTSEIEMAETEHERNLKATEMQATLMTQRLNNAAYKEALTTAGNIQRLSSKEDFAAAMSDQGLERGKLSDVETRRQTKYVEDYARDKNTAISMGEIDAALKKSIADSKASVQKAGVEAMTGGMKTGMSAASSDGDWGDFGGDGDTDVGEGTVKAPKAGPQEDTLPDVFKQKEQKPGTGVLK